jgi:hypothetical protein
LNEHLIEVTEVIEIPIEKHHSLKKSLENSRARTPIRLEKRKQGEVWEVMSLEVSWEGGDSLRCYCQDFDFYTN